jgi:hypothetical protein
MGCQKCQKSSRHPFGTFGTPSISVSGKYTPPQFYALRGGTPFALSLCTLRTSGYQYFIDVFSRLICNFCMMLVMVKEADLNRIDVPEDYEVLDATALGKRLGFKRDTVLAYLSRRNFRRIPRPNRQLAMGPIWYEKSVREWEAKEERVGRVVSRSGNGVRTIAPRSDAISKRRG